jgi:hypothetical protein
MHDIEKTMSEKEYKTDDLDKAPNYDDRNTDNMYVPDKWVITRITSKEYPQIDKILASWYCGYASSDSWRFSSGITEVEEAEHFYIIHNHSGSQYYCRKTCEGMSSYTESVFKDLSKKLKEQDMGEIQIINVKELL